MPKKMELDFGMVKLAIEGRYDEWVDKQKRVVATGYTSAIRRSTTGLKNELRRQVKKAGLGDKVAKAWRSETWPRRGRSMSAAGAVYSKAQKIHLYFDEAQTIEAKRKQWLAIPTENAVSKDRRRRAKPADYRGKLRFVPGKKAGTAVLMDKQDQVVFVLVKQVRGRKRLNIDQAVKKWGDKVPATAVKEMDRAAKRLGLE